MILIASSFVFPFVFCDANHIPSIIIIIITLGPCLPPKMPDDQLVSHVTVQELQAKGRVETLLHTIILIIALLLYSILSHKNCINMPNCYIAPSSSVIMPY